MGRLSQGQDLLGYPRCLIHPKRPCNVFCGPTNSSPRLALSRSRVLFLPVVMARSSLSSPAELPLEAIPAHKHHLASLSRVAGHRNEVDTVEMQGKHPAFALTGACGPHRRLSSRPLRLSTTRLRLRLDLPCDACRQTCRFDPAHRTRTSIRAAIWILLSSLRQEKVVVSAVIQDRGRSPRLLLPPHWSTLR